MPGAAAPAGHVDADTIGAVFGELAEAASRLAAAADGHRADAVMLYDAWPR